MTNHEAFAAAMGQLTSLDVETFWLEAGTSEDVISEASVATTGDARVLLAHHLFTVADELGQSFEETADEAAAIAAENFTEPMNHEH